MDVGGNISDLFHVSQQLACAAIHETGRLLKFKERCLPYTATESGRYRHMQLALVGKNRHNISMIGQEITDMFITSFLVSFRQNC